jgi:hypothetical protein
VAAFAGVECDRIRERITKVKPDRRERGRFLGGSVPFGFQRSDSGFFATCGARFTFGTRVKFDLMLSAEPAQAIEVE